MDEIEELLANLAFFTLAAISDPRDFQDAELTDENLNLFISGIMERVAHAAACWGAESKNREQALLALREAEERIKALRVIIAGQEDS